eukprot:scaffold127685_cov22-Tisochrysis_lutea.AAC.3
MRTVGDLVLGYTQLESGTQVIHVEQVAVLLDSDASPVVRPGPPPFMWNPHVWRQVAQAMHNNLHTGGGAGSCLSSDAPWTTSTKVDQLMELLHRVLTKQGASAGALPPPSSTAGPST